MLTEEEAKAKWCPFVRFHGTPSDDCVPNRNMPMENVTLCLGSACMAWRWVDWHDCGIDGMIASTGPAAKGYCGLAGNPGVL